MSVEADPAPRTRCGHVSQTHASCSEPLICSASTCGWLTTTVLHTASTTRNSRTCRHHTQYNRLRSYGKN